MKKTPSGSADSGAGAICGRAAFSSIADPPRAPIGEKPDHRPERCHACGAIARVISR